MKRKNKKFLITSAVALFILGIFFGVRRLNAKEPIIMTISSNFPITEDLNQMNSEADIIVIGKYTNFKESWNMSRDDYDLTKEHEKSYVEGHIYNFSTTAVIRGEIIDSNILINHHYGRDHYIEEANENLFIVNDLYKEPEMNEEYILFLKYDENFNLYYGAIEPFTIKINRDQTLELYTPLTEKIDNSENKTFELESGKTLIVKEHTEELIEDFIEGKNLDSLLEELSIN